MIKIILKAAAISPERELSHFAAARDAGDGALVSFVGYCRGRAASGAVTTLELQHYPGFTEAEIERLAHKIAFKHAISELLAIHRVGAVPAGEAIVLVAALSPHRAAAFAAVEAMMDYLKTDAPLWKRETGPAGARWIEPTSEDHARRQEHGS